MNQVPPTCSPVARAVLQYPCRATHRFFNTKPFDYSIYNREVCSCPCETAPTLEPYFLSDRNGNLLRSARCRMGRSFPWSNYLLDMTTSCEQKHYPIRITNIPHAPKSKSNKSQYPSTGNYITEATCQCTDHLAKKLEEDSDLLDIDPDLTPLQRQLEIGLRKLRKVQPPTVWILGHPHGTTSPYRENFARALAAKLDYKYINMNMEIWNRTQTSPEDLAAISEALIKTGDHVSNSAHSRLMIMSWKLTSNPSITLSEEGVLEMMKLMLIHYHNAKGFVIDSFPCNSLEATGFEAMLYPVTFAIYVRPPEVKAYRPRKKSEHESKGIDSGENKHHENRGSIIEPPHFRRSHSYHEIEVQALAHKYKDELRALVLDHGRDFGDHEVELAAALVLEELSRKIKAKKELLKTYHPPTNYHDMIGPEPRCYNPYCACHVAEDEGKNSLLLRDEQAMTNIVDRMRRNQEEFHTSLLDLLDKRCQEKDENATSLARDTKSNTEKTFGESTWTGVSSVNHEGHDFTHNFKFHEVRSGQIGHGHHSDHHALRDTCSRNQEPESTVQFLMKPTDKETAEQDDSDTNDKGGIVTKMGWTNLDSNSNSKDKVRDSNAQIDLKVVNVNNEDLGDDDEEFLEDFGEEGDDEYEDISDAPMEEDEEEDEEEDNDIDNIAPIPIANNINNVIPLNLNNFEQAAEAQQRSIGGGDGGGAGRRRPPEEE